MKHKLYITTLVVATLACGLCMPAQAAPVTLGFDIPVQASGDWTAMPSPYSEDGYTGLVSGSGGLMDRAWNTSINDFTGNVVGSFGTLVVDFTRDDGKPFKATSVAVGIITTASGGSGGTWQVTGYCNDGTVVYQDVGGGDNTRTVINFNADFDHLTNLVFSPGLIDWYAPGFDDLVLDDASETLPVASIAFGNMNDLTPGTPPSGRVTDVNDDKSLPGQIGAWNELLLGDVGYPPEPSKWTATDRTIAGVLDGDGNATTVGFTLYAGIGYYVYSQPLVEPNQTALYRNTMWNGVSHPTQRWEIAGLEASTEYTLRLFGWQNNASGAALFASFSATGSGATVTGTNTLLHNYTDLVVTSTASGQITGERYSATAGAWSGLQIQGAAPFLLASDLISIDFKIANPVNQTGTASGYITDFNGDTSWGQAGAWNSLLSGTVDGGTWQSHSEQPSISNMLDGTGDATTVDFQFNTGEAAVNTYSVSTFPVLHGGAFVLSDTGSQDALWTIAGLQPYTWYTMRMFGMENAGGPLYFATFEATGGMGDIDSGSTSLTTNYVDLTVRSTLAGEITGKLVKTAPGGAAWSGMQILKGDKFDKLLGSIIIIR